MQQPPDLKVYSKNLINLEEMRKNWYCFLFLGLLLVGLGFFAVASSTIVTVVSVILLGSLLLVGGVVQSIYAFWMRDWSGFSLSLLAGILYTVVGLMCILHPAASAISLTLLLAAFYMVGGIFRIITATMARFEQWGWAFLSGVIKFVLGLLIFLEWPETGLWVLGLFIGIDLIFFGWFWILLALSARNAPPAKS